MRSLLAPLLYLSLISFAAAQTAPVNVPDVDADFAHGWQQLPPTFLLAPANAAQAGARTGKVWVRKVEEGLLVTGSVDGAAPAFPASVDTIMTSEHVEIWLAQQPDPQFPKLGWGNQHGDISLADENGCPAALHITDAGAPEIQACQEWVHQQQSYRAQLRRLFVRQWMLAPGLGLETWATPAHMSVSQTAMDRDMLALLKPQGTPGISVHANPAGGYDFETLIPWAMFPPSDSTALQKLFLTVQIATPGAGPGGLLYSTTAPQPGNGAPADPSVLVAFSRIRLQHPKQYAITPCHYDAIGKGFFNTALPGFFLPAATENINKTFVFENDRRGYMDEADGLSPDPELTTFYSRPLQQGGALCGPLMRVQPQPNARPVDLVLTEKSGKVTGPVVIDQADLGVLETPEGLLLRNGPRLTMSQFGAGACGMCPRMALDLYAVDASFNVTVPIHFYDIVSESVLVDDEDLQVAADWSRVSRFRHEQIKDMSGQSGDSYEWNTQFFCRKGLTYEACGVAAVSPPDPRTLTLPSR